MALSYSVPDSVLSTTLQNSRSMIEDNVFTAVPLLYWLVGKFNDSDQLQGSHNETGNVGRKELKDGGYTIVQPLMYGKNTTAKAYNGYDLLDVTPQEGITAAQFNWKQNSASVSISGKEERQNAGEKQIVSLLKSKITQAEMSLIDEMARQLAGVGTDSTLDMLGLQTMISTTGTVGGIARAANIWWRANVTAGGSFATTGIDNMRDKYNSISKGNEHPDLVISNQVVFQYYEKLLQSQERFTDSKTADAGFENLKFKGAVYMFDNNTYFPAGTQYFLNSKYLHLTVHKDADFATTDFIRPQNQDARVAQILWMGEFNISNCARQGAVTTIIA